MNHGATLAMTLVALRHIRRLALLVAVALATVLAAGGGSALADFGFKPGSLSADAFNAAGQYETQAGAHPYSASTTFHFNTKDDGNGLEIPDHWVKDIQVDLPQGFVGDPQAAPTCAWAALSNGLGAQTCPPETQVGTVDLDWFPINPPRENWTLPLFNMEPSNGHVAEFGFKTSLTQSQLVASVRPGDNGIRIRTNNISQGGVAFGVTVTLWGVPGDPVHDAERGAICTSSSACFGGGNLFNSKIRPFLTNPTECAGPLTTTFRARSWEDPSTWVTAKATTAATVTGCDRLSFEPTITARPDVSTPASPAGLAVDLTVPQNSGPTELATATLRTAKVALPEGVVVNPGSADGLGACSDAQIDLQSEAAPGCPESSRIGTVTLTTPVLPRPVLGSVYLGRQTPSQLLRLFLVLDDQGLIVEAAGPCRGRVRAPGQLTSTFVDNPQLPFGNLHLELKGGARAPLSTPAACGTFTTRAELTPWSSLDRGGGRRRVRRPRLRRRSVVPRRRSRRVGNAAAGEHGTFQVRVTRTGAENALAGRRSLRPACWPASRTCPPGAAGFDGRLRPRVADRHHHDQRRIGQHTGLLAAGRRAPTAVYLAGPYKGAPFSLSIVVPPRPGRFDLGVVVQARLDIDPITAQATVPSILPTIMKGIALTSATFAWMSIARAPCSTPPTTC